MNKSTRPSQRFRDALLAGIAVLFISPGFAQSPGGAPSTDKSLSASKLQSGTQPTTKPFLLEQIYERSETWSEQVGPQFSDVARWYRDSRGRMRIQEKETCAIIQTMSFPCSSNFWSTTRIFDPGTGTGYWWDPSSRTAHVVQAPEMEANLRRTPWERAFETMGDLRLNVPPPPDDSVPPLEVKHESLGEKMFEGVLLRGSWDTMTMPAGWMGSKNPTKRTCETWTSPELGMVLISDCTDLVTGTTRTRLVHVDLSEPDPSLFQVPEGYKIVTEPPIDRKAGHKAPAL